jgi:hypothetical protein
MDTLIDKEIFLKILVFKTNISTNNDVEKVKHLLALEKYIQRWNIDREDVDNVLRIECIHLQPSIIIQLLRCAGFMCEELPD